MELPIIRIGNSKGIRLSKLLLDKYQLSEKVELLLEEDHMVIRPLNSPRKNWDQAFAEMHHNGDDELLVEDVLDDQDWED